MLINKEIIKSKFEQALALSNPPITLNHGTSNESIFFLKTFGKTQRETRLKREWRLAQAGFEHDVWEVCNPDKDLANAVIDYASTQT